MINKLLINQQIHNILERTDFQNLGKKINGKVRDIYDLGSRICFITTDRQSAFDRILALVPFKGQVLTESSHFWFEKTKEIVPNHLIEMPDPNVMIGKKLTIFPVEFVVRGYLTGVTSTSVWTAYQKGIRSFCGNILPENMKKNQAFLSPIVTPTTKSNLEDKPITPKEIIQKKLMSAEDWETCKSLSIKLFNFGQNLLRDNDLILVDTKYEFGYDESGKIYLCDEIHTPDSSRFWIQSTYQQNILAEKEPNNIDKEFLRIWFNENCDPYKDKILPKAPTDLICELSSRYIQAYEMITENNFIYHEQPIQERIKKNLSNNGYFS